MAYVVDAAAMSISGTPGTGTITLGAAKSSYLSFSAAGCVAGEQYSYSLHDGANRESGVGTYVGDGTFTRDRVDSSTAGGTTKISATSSATIVITPVSANINFVNTANTVAAFQAGFFTFGTTSVTILGYSTVGVGGFTVRRVNTPPPHQWRFRSKDRFTASGGATPDNTNGGWWEGYADDGVLNLEAFGATCNGIADDYQAFRDALDYAKYMEDQTATALSYNDDVGFYKIKLSRGAHRSSQTLVLDRIIQIEGVGYAGTVAGGVQSLITFDTGRDGFVLEGWASLNGIKGADGSVLKNFTVNQAAYASQPSAGCWDGTVYAGIRLNCKALIDSVGITNFAGHGLVIDATAGGFGTPTDGNANSMRVTNCFFNGNYLSGFWVHGADANQITIDACTVFGNGTWGVEDNSFLGNQYFGVTAEGNDAMFLVPYSNVTTAVVDGSNNVWLVRPSYLDANATTAATTPPGTNAAVWFSIGPNGFGAGAYPRWGDVIYNGVAYRVVGGQEANMWTSQPDTHPAVWTNIGAPPAGQKIYWRANWTPYRSGGSFAATNGNQNTSFYGCYIESNHHKVNYFNATRGMAYGGIDMNLYNWTGSLTQTKGIMYGGGSYSTRSQSPTEGVAGEPYVLSAIGANIAGDLTISYYDVGGYVVTVAPDPVRDYDVYCSDNSFRLLWGITGSATTQTFGRSAAVPGAFFLPRGAWLGSDDGGLGTMRNISFGSAAPASGAWSQGDIRFNSAAAVGQPVGWRCTVSGTPGTWVSF